MSDYIKNQLAVIDSSTGCFMIKLGADLGNTDFLDITKAQYETIKKILIGEEQTIEIVVEGGVVQEVNNLPDNFVYEIKDLD